MGKREVRTLKGGMILGEDLYTPEGKRILRKGEPLGDRHIRMMKIWGIPEAAILEEKPQEELPPEQDPGHSAFFDRAFRLVDAWFPPNSLEDPLMKELRRLCALRVARAMKEGTLPEGLFPRVQVSPPQMPDSEELDFSAHSLVRNEAQLASYPDIYFRIKEVLDSPVSSARHIAEVVSTDPNLSMRLLRLVNSSFYGFPYPIESIPRAVTIIGSRELTNLALAVSTMSIFQGVPEEYVEMRSFWEHSLACGVIARILANLRRFPEEERFFLAGLFHDAGKLVLYRKKPRVMTALLAFSRHEKLPMFEVEDRILGFNHAYVGGLLLKEWNIPLTLQHLVQVHHSPDVLAFSPEAAVVHVADVLAGAMRWGTSGSFYVPSLDSEACSALDLSAGVLERVLTQSERQMREILQVFFGKDSHHGSMA
jgi:HD-like signal output (HDOD) protein